MFDNIISACYFLEICQCIADTARDGSAVPLHGRQNVHGTSLVCVDP